MGKFTVVSFRITRGEPLTIIFTGHSRWNIQKRKSGFLVFQNGAPGDKYGSFSGFTGDGSIAFRSGAGDPCTAPVARP